MKTLVTLFFLASCAFPGIAQKMLIGVQTELTASGYQSGASILVETNKQWSFGGFYQAALAQPGETYQRNSFYGFQALAPLAKSEKLSFFATLRGGLANNQFVVVVPGLETKVSLGKRLYVAVGMSVRMNYPAISSKLIIKLF